LFKLIAFHIKQFFMVINIKAIANVVSDMFITINSISVTLLLFYGYAFWFICAIFVIGIIYLWPYAIAREIFHMTQGKSTTLSAGIMLCVLIYGLKSYLKKKSSINQKIKSKFLVFSPSTRTAFHLKHFYLSTVQAQIPLATEYWEVHLKPVLPPKPDFRNIATYKEQIEQDIQKLKEVLPSDTIIFGNSPRNLMPLIEGTSAEKSLVVYSKATIPPERAKLYRKYPRQWDYIVLFIKGSKAAATRSAAVKEG